MVSHGEVLHYIRIYSYPVDAPQVPGSKGKL